MAENLELRHDEFSQRLCDMTGCSLEEAKKEVETAIQRLFYWGAYADKFGGTVQVSLEADQQMIMLTSENFERKNIKMKSFPLRPFRSV